MRRHLREASGLIRNFDDAYAHAVQTLKLFRNEYSYPRIGCVSGPFTSCWPGRVEENRRGLIYLAGLLGEMHHFPIFAIQDLFSLDTLERLKAGGYTSWHYADFSSDVLGSGYVTNLFMAPGWEESITSRAEHEAAKRFGLDIHHIEYLS